MKRIYLPTLLIILLVSYYFLYQRESPKEKYLSHMKSASSKMYLDGPGKAILRDVVMTMNPSTGTVNTENVRAFYNEKKRARTQDDGFQWEQVDSELAGRVRSIMIDPNDGNKLWAGAVTGGLWYTSDFRNNSEWVPVSDDWESLSIACITYDPNDTQTFYVGTGESYTSVRIYRESSSSGAGIYKTTDGGATWTLLSSTTDFSYVNDIVIRDEDGLSVIYAAVASGLYQGNVFGSLPSDGLYRSTDGGMTWSQVLPNISGSSVPYAVSDIELTPEGTLYVGTMRNLEQQGGGEILISTDGINWELDDFFYAQDIIAEGQAVYNLDLIPGRVRLTSGPDVVYAVATSGWYNDFSQIRDHSVFTRLFSKHLGPWEPLDGPGSWASIPWHALAIQIDPNNTNRLVAGGLDLHALSDASNPTTLSWIKSSDWVSMYHFSDYTRELFFGGIDQDFSDSMLTHFVHADIHDIEFGVSSDEILISNDGGVHFSSDFTKNYEIPSGDRLDEYASFQHINNSFATTQYYTVALHPSPGNNEVLAGSQDNSTHTSESGSITYDKMIGGGDGAYCFFDSDDLNLRITSSQVGNYNFWVNGEDEYFYGVGGGTFINPADYDDRSNLLYSNLAVDGGFEALSESLIGQFLNKIAILNVNKFLKEDDLGLDTLTHVDVGTGSGSSFSAVKVSPHSNELNATLFLGNQTGDIYRITGMPYDPVSEKIDNNQLPVGYISSIDVGDNENQILVTFSNYGVESVWCTRNGGDDWHNIERNLPDIPVRHGMFNPLDDQKILLATEVGVWGLENILDENEEWVSYNEGLPNVRVDMIDARGSDSVIVAATHGRGIFLGKFDQGELVPPLGLNEPNFVSIYPNPASSSVRVEGASIKSLRIYTISGREVMRFQDAVEEVDISQLNKGIYLVRLIDENNIKHSFKLIKE